MAFRWLWCFVDVGGGGVGHVCELADQAHATLWLPAGACIHGWGGLGWVMY